FESIFCSSVSPSANGHSRVVRFLVSPGTPFCSRRAKSPEVIEGGGARRGSRSERRDQARGRGPLAEPRAGGVSQVSSEGRRRNKFPPLSLELLHHHRAGGMSAWLAPRAQRLKRRQSKRSTGISPRPSCRAFHEQPFSGRADWSSRPF